MKIIGILGAGVMGSVFFSVLRRVEPSARFIICDHDAHKLAYFKKRGRRVVVTQNGFDLASADVVILAVKPQDFSSAKILVNPSALVISIMAGVSILAIQKKLHTKKIIRAMPNMLARVKRGFTVWTSTKSVSLLERKRVAAIFAAMGDHLYTDREGVVDKATAITGSGPAYIFLTLSAFEQSARALGFSAADARHMVRSVIVGSLEISAHQDVNDLIAQVASKKGTTDAALREFSRHHFVDIWRHATRAAYRRALELRR